jgi:hypothetical protein
MCAEVEGTARKRGTRKRAPRASHAALRRASDGVGEFEGRSPSIRIGGAKPRRQPRASDSEASHAIGASRRSGERERV